MKPVKAVVYGGSRDGDVVELKRLADSYLLKSDDSKFITFSGADFISPVLGHEVYVLQRFAFDEGKVVLNAYVLAPNSMGRLESAAVKADAVKRGTLVTGGGE